MIELFDEGQEEEEKGEEMPEFQKKRVSSVCIVCQGIRPSKSSKLSSWLRRLYNPLS